MERLERREEGKEEARGIKGKEDRKEEMKHEEIKRGREGRGEEVKGL